LPYGDPRSFWNFFMTFFSSKTEREPSGIVTKQETKIRLFSFSSPKFPLSTCFPTLEQYGNSTSPSFFFVFPSFALRACHKTVRFFFPTFPHSFYVPQTSIFLASAKSLAGDSSLCFSLVLFLVSRRETVLPRFLRSFPHPFILSNPLVLVGKVTTLFSRLSWS